MTTDRPGFYGYRRPDGRVGTRNHVLVVPTVICSSLVAERIAAAAPPFASRAAAPRRLRAARTGHARHARDARGLLRATPTSAPSSSSRSGASRSSRRCWPRPRAPHGKPAEIVAIQSEGGTVRATEKGSAIARSFAALLAAQEREWCDVSELVLSLKCGGSDYTSGLASNPTLGRVTDRLVELGGSAVLGEIAEIMGAEHLLASRATRPETAAQLIQIITRVGGRGAGARARHPRHAAVARQHPRRPDDDRGEVARRHAQRRRARAARGRRAVRGPHPPQGADGHGHARARRRVRHGHGRRRRAGGRLHDRARHADRQPDRAGHQDHRQRAHRAGRWPTTSTSRSAGS